MDALKELKWFLLILALLWIVWFFTGGPQRFESINKPFIQPITSPNSGQVYGPR